jgi:thymidylate synthase (FAD)
MTFDPLGDRLSSVTFVDSMGTDLSVVNAARVSFDKQSKADSTSYHTFEGKEVEVPTLNSQDIKLLNYLAKHNHWTPFGHVQLSLRVKAPIFVARQLVKHQVGLVWNEVSRRYVNTPPEFYTTKELRLAPEGSIKQGSSNKATSIFTEVLQVHHASCLRIYEAMLVQGVAPEEARMVLPLSTYTEWVWSGSLAAWLRIVQLRCDPHAQSQTQAYGFAFAEVLRTLFPHSYLAFRGELDLGNLPTSLT